MTDKSLEDKRRKAASSVKETIYTGSRFDENSFIGQMMATLE